MIKVIDVDTLFDEYISGYVYKNIGNIKLHHQWYPPEHRRNE